MIFTNPAGAPELACDECGCRWFDRMTGACYECGAEVPAAARIEFEAALAVFAASRTSVTRRTDGTPLSAVDPLYKLLER